MVLGPCHTDGPWDRLQVRPTGDATAVVTTAFFIGILRSSYEVLTRDVLRLTGARRRTVLVGEGEQLAALRRMLGADRSGIRYEFLGAIAPGGEAGDLPVLGGLDAVPRILREHDVHELIVTDGGFGERDARAVEELPLRARSDRSPHYGRSSGRIHSPKGAAVELRTPASRDRRGVEARLDLSVVSSSSGLRSGARLPARSSSLGGPVFYRARASGSSSGRRDDSSALYAERPSARLDEVDNETWSASRSRTILADALGRSPLLARRDATGLMSYGGCRW